MTTHLKNVVVQTTFSLAWDDEEGDVEPTNEEVIQYAKDEYDIADHEWTIIASDEQVTFTWPGVARHLDACYDGWKEWTDDGGDTEELRRVADAIEVIQALRVGWPISKALLIKVLESEHKAADEALSDLCIWPGRDPDFEKNYIETGAPVRLLAAALKQLKGD